MARIKYKNYETSCSVMDLNSLQDELFGLSIGIVNLLLVDSVLHVRTELDLSVEQKTLVDTAISNFVDTDLTQKIPLIYDIAKAEAASKHFHNIDYKKEIMGALIPERETGTMKGEVREVFWFRDMVDNVPTTKVLRANIQYFRDASGFAMYRITARTYYNRDGTENPEVKTTIKYYFINQQDMIDEGIKRRTLLIKSIQIPTMTFIAEVLMPLGVTMDNVVLKGRKFMDDYEDHFNKFKHNSSTETDPLSDDFGIKNVIIKLRDEAYPGHVEWLDKMPNSLGGSTSIRQHLIEEFSI